jgi:hypothetical protein
MLLSQEVNMCEEKKGTSRRDFLKAGSVLGAGLATTMVGLKTVEAAPFPEKWDEEYDVIVVGSGFAGLAAAYTAKKAGARVIVLEKMKTLGGNSIINGGLVAAAGSPLQEKRGIKDSPEMLYQDMLRAGKNLNHKNLARMVADESWPVVQYTMDEWGVQYGSLSQLGGHSVPRSYNTANGSGSGIVTKQIEACKKLGVVLKTRTYVENIVVNRDKRVCGLKVIAGYRFGKAGSGKPKTIRALKGVVLASGWIWQRSSLKGGPGPLLGFGCEIHQPAGCNRRGLVRSPETGLYSDSDLVDPDWPLDIPGRKGNGYVLRIQCHCLGQWRHVDQSQYRQTLCK